MARKRSKGKQKVAHFKWSANRAACAVLLAHDELTEEEIAKKIGTTRKTIWDWKCVQEFADRVEEHRKQFADAAARYEIGKRLRRLSSQNSRWLKLQSVIDERAKSDEFKDAPGGKTGLLVKTPKSIGVGANAKLVDVYAVDVATLKAFLELEKHAAQELGQFAEKVDITSGGKPLPTVPSIIEFRELPPDAPKTTPMIEDVEIDG